MGGLSLPQEVGSSIAALQSDADGRAVATNLVQRIVAGKDVNRYVQEFWAKDCVAIKSLRAGIGALSEEMLGKLPKSSADLTLLAFLQYIREIVSTPRHSEHLSIAEWKILWLAVSRAASAGIGSPQIISLACVCWSHLLDVTTAVPPDLSNMMDEIVLKFSLDDEREQIYDGHLMACAHKLFKLLHTQKSYASETAMRFAVKLWTSRHRVKNVQFIREAAGLACMLDFDLSWGEASSIVGHLNSYAEIQPDHVVFTPDAKLAKFISPLRDSEDFSWTVSAALARVAKHVSHESQPESDIKGRATKKPRHELDLGVYSSQIACFTQDPPLPSTFSEPSWWTFILYGQYISGFSGQDLVEICHNCVKSINLFSSAASFCLAQALHELTRRDEQAQATLTELNVLLSDLDGLQLSFGSIYLYRVIKSLRIVDVELCNLIPSMLDPWLRKKLTTGLQSSDFQFQMVLDLWGVDLDLDFTTIKPSKRSFVPYLFFCIRHKQTCLEKVPDRFTKEEVRDLIEGCQFLARKGISLGPDFTQDLEESVTRSSIHEELQLTAHFVLRENQPPNVQQLPYAPAMENATEEYFKSIVSGVFGKYQYNRSIPHIEQVISMMSQMDRTPSWQEFYKFLFVTIKSQSSFSPLRVPLSHLVSLANDWKILLETSTLTDVFVMLESFTPPSKDFELVLNADIHPFYQADFYYALARRGGDPCQIVLKLLLSEHHHHLEITARFYKSTLRGLFMDVGSRVFWGWCQLRNADEFPWHAFKIEPDSFYSILPLKVLPLAWMAEPSLFASFYVLGLQDDAVSQALEGSMRPSQYEIKQKRFAAQIILKCWSCVLLPDDPVWSGFPAPKQFDSWLDNVPEQFFPDDEMASWIIEQLVLSGCRRRPEGDLYTILRQIWHLYNMLPRRNQISTVLIRACLALCHIDDGVLPAVRHLLKQLAEHGQIEGMILAELLVFDPHVFTSNYDLNELPTTPIVLVLLAILRKETVNPVIFAQAIVELENQEYPLYIARFIFEGMAPIDALTDEDRKAVSGPLSYWTKVLEVSDRVWLSFVGRLIAENGDTAVQSHDSDESPRAKTIKALREFCQRKGYLERFSINPFLRRMGPNSLVRMSFSGVSKDFNPKSVLTSDGDSVSIANLKNTTTSDTDLAAMLFEYIVPCCMYRAFQISPELGPLIIPFEAAEACSNATTLGILSEVLAAQLANPDSKVQGLVLDIAKEIYNSGHILDCGADLIPLCIKLGRGDLGLMLVELEWSKDTSQLPLGYYEVVNIVPDPDIQSTKPLTPSLNSLSLSRWEKLSFDIAYFGNDTNIGSDLRTFGIYNLASMVEKNGFYDYDSALALQQWDMPAAEPPRTESEVLFNLLRSKDKFDFSAAYDARLPSSLLGKLLQIEHTVAPQMCGDANTRLGREMMLRRHHAGPEMLAGDLSLNCDRFCALKNKEMAVLYAKKLERLAINQAPDFSLLSSIASAKTAWLLGDEAMAIQMLEAVVDHSAFPNSKLFDCARVLCTLANWSSEARQASDAEIQTKMLIPAVESAKMSKDAAVQADTYHTFAVFCDNKFKDPTLTRDMYQAKHMRDEHRSNLDVYQRSLQLNKGDKALQSKIRRTHQQCETEQKEYIELKAQLRSYLDNSLKFYLKSLEVSHSDILVLNDSSRFIALWFSNPEVATRAVKRYLPSVPSHVFVPWVNQLTSRLENNAMPFQTLLQELIVKLARDHPYHLLWPLMSLTLNSSSAKPDVAARAAAAKGIWKACASSCQHGIAELTTHFVNVARFPVKSEDKNRFGFNKMKGESKWWQSIKKLKLVCPAQQIEVDKSCTYSNLPTIESVDMAIAIASGLSAPKIVHYTTSSGQVLRMLLKSGNDDLRQDAVMEQVFGHVEFFLKSDNNARKRNLGARTYAVVPLGPHAGVLEFVPNTRSLYEILHPLHSDPREDQWQLSKARQTMHAAFEFGKEARYEAYMAVTEHVKPVMRKFFFQQYRDAQEWVDKRTCFSRSTATMSIVGYVLGLGDRHCNNVLVDVESGEAVHIDLGIAFDQGKLLRIPETVPFRLTRDIVDGMGASGVRGVFTKCAEITLRLLRSEEEKIMTVLEVLRYDPLYAWNVSALRTKLAQPASANTTSLSIRANNGTSAVSTDAEQALLGVRRKLSAKLNVTASVRELVDQATSPRNLALLFEGWAPFY